MDFSKWTIAGIALVVLATIRLATLCCGMLALAQTRSEAAEQFSIEGGLIKLQPTMFASMPTVYDAKAPDPVDWSSFLAHKANIVGCINSNAFDFHNRPIVQGTKELGRGYYLSHDVDNESAVPGEAFVSEYCNGFDGELTYVYGHHTSGRLDDKLFYHLTDVFTDQSKHYDVTLNVPELKSDGAYSSKQIAGNVLGAQRVDADKIGETYGIQSHTQLNDWWYNTIAPMLDVRFCDKQPSDRVLVLVTCSKGEYKNERVFVYVAIR